MLRRCAGKISPVKFFRSNFLLTGSGSGSLTIHYNYGFTGNLWIFVTSLNKFRYLRKSIEINNFLIY